MAVALAFAVAGPVHLSRAFACTAAFLLLAFARLLVRGHDSRDAAESRRRLRAIWSVVLVSTLGWGAFSAWSAVSLPDPAPLVSLLFSGAFGMALAHTLCMRRLPSLVAIPCVTVPSLVLLRMRTGPGVAVMWIVYTTYMLLVMNRSHREYRTRIELEEDLRQQRDLYEKQSRVDGLTGLANRREFTDALERAIARTRAGGRLALLILDIDHFKRINDTHGHLAGDACLVALARRLQQHFGRPGDLGVRLGGEEFAVVMDAGQARALERAERFRTDLARVPLALEGEAIALAVSVGCGAFDPARHADGDALYRDVDAALYRAKLGGRDRTETVAG